MNSTKTKRIYRIWTALFLLKWLRLSSSPPKPRSQIILQNQNLLVPLALSAQFSLVCIYFLCYFQLLILFPAGLEILLDTKNTKDPKLLYRYCTAYDCKNIITNISRFSKNVSFVVSDSWSDVCIFYFFLLLKPDGLNLHLRYARTHLRRILPQKLSILCGSGTPSTLSVYYPFKNISSKKSK